MKGLKLLLLLVSFSIKAQDLGFALEQIHAEALLSKGLTGKGIKVGVIDGGFLKANRSKTLGHLFQNNQIAGYKDYLTPKAEPYSGSKALDDGHGTEVLSLIAGYDSTTNIRFGMATGATFYLARTDHGGYEKRKEEQYAIQAMKWMAKEGVKIINISLGYTNEFDNPKENYAPEQIDGKSVKLTQMVDELSEKHDILFIISAGNDGDRNWKIIGAPADAKSALSVGATKFKIWDDLQYSSIGPEWLPYVKPDMSCYATGGTSFSAPIITGLAACVLEKNPELSGEQLKQTLLDLCNLRHAPNNRLGYGVPDCRLLFMERTPPKIIEEKGKICTIPITSEPPYVPVYHKKGTYVLEKEKLEPKGNKVKVSRPKEATKSTVLINNQGIEIIWVN